MPAQQNLGRVLVEIGLISDADLAELEVVRHRSKLRLSEQIVISKIVTEDRLVSELSKYLDMDIADPARTPIHERVLSVVPAEVAHRHRVIPMARRKDDDVESLFVVTADPFDEEASRVLASLVPDGVALRFVLAGETEISKALREHYGGRPRVDTVSGPAPQATWDESVGVRMGGSAAMPMSQSMLPDGEFEAAETAVDSQPHASSPPPPKKPRPTKKRMPSAASNQIGAYSLETRVSVSGMAETWDAMHVSGAIPKTHVRLRRMLPTIPKNERSRAKFFGAARRMVDVEHENLIAVIAAESLDGHDYVVSAPAVGTELDRVLHHAPEKKRRFDVGLALYVMQGVLRGLQAAHDAMVFHEYLSPRSVLITTDGMVKVFDFGVAPTLLEERGRYVTPEQSFREADERTDVYLAGLILFELLAGTPLVAASEKDPDRTAQALQSMRKTLVERRSDIQPPVFKLLSGMLHISPDRRFESAEVCLAEVDAILGRMSDAPGAVQLMHYVEESTAEDIESSPMEGAAEAISSVAAASQRAIKNAAEEVAPAMKRAGERAVPMLDGLIEKFEQFMAASLGVKLAAAAGVFFVVVLLSTIVAVIVSGQEPPPQQTVTIADEPTSPTAPTKRVVSPPPSKRRAAVEVFDGVDDGPAPEGFKYTATHGVELRATADEDGEVLLWLEVGQTVREISDVEGQKLVLIPPRGPAGFVMTGDLTTTLPLEALARSVAFTKCSVTRSRSLDDCMFGSKQKHDQCLDQCQGREGTRCKPACDLAFETCLKGCREGRRR